MSIALSSEPAETVEPYLIQNDITNVIVGSGSSAGGKYGVTKIPHTVIIDADGNLAWVGYPGDVNKGMLKAYLKGAKKPAGGLLGVRTDFNVDARVAKAQSLARDGKVASALKETAAIAADATATEQQKSDAQGVHDAIVRHAKTLSTTAEALIKAKDVARALLVFDALAKELADDPSGASAKERATAIRADAKLMSEVEAAKAFEKLREQVKPLATEKAKGKYEEFAKKWKDTRAGERAKALTRGGKS